METKETKNIWIGVVVIALIAGAYYFGTESKNTNTNQNTETPVTTQEITQQQNQVTPIVTSKPQVVAPQNTYTNFELSENPKYLYSKDFNPYKAKVFGAGVGDSSTKINPVSIIQQQEYGGWVHTTNGTGYRIVNGEIAEIALNNDGIANFITDNEVIIKFGDPDRTTQGGTAPYAWTTYYYINRGIVVTNYQQGGIKVNIIGN